MEDKIQSVKFILFAHTWVTMKQAAMVIRKRTAWAFTNCKNRMLFKICRYPGTVSPANEHGNNLFLISFQNMAVFISFPIPPRGLALFVDNSISFVGKISQNMSNHFENNNATFQIGCF